MTTPEKPDDEVANLRDAAEKLREKADELSRAAGRIDRSAKGRSWREVLLWIALSASLLGGGWFIETENHEQNVRIEQLEKRSQAVPTATPMTQPPGPSGNPDPSIRSQVSALEAKLDRLHHLVESLGTDSNQAIELVQSTIDDLKSLSQKTCTPELREEVENIYSDLQAVIATKVLQREQVTRAELKLRRHLLKFLKLCAPGT